MSECQAGRGSEVAAPARRSKPECLNTVRIPPRLQQRNGLEVRSIRIGNQPGRSYSLSGWPDIDGLRRNFAERDFYFAGFPQFYAVRNVLQIIEL